MVSSQHRRDTGSREVVEDMGSHREVPRTVTDNREHHQEEVIPNKEGHPAGTTGSNKLQTTAMLNSQLQVTDNLEELMVDTDSLAEHEVATVVQGATASSKHRHLQAMAAEEATLSSTERLLTSTKVEQLTSLLSQLQLFNSTM